MKILPALLLLSGLLAPAHGAEVAKQQRAVALEPSSRLWLQGDSTLHAYHSTATAMALAAQAELAGAPASGNGLVLLYAAQAGKMERFELTIPVKSLKSGKAALDKKMYESLKAEEAPSIVFKLSSFHFQAASGGAYEVKAVGTLSVAGKERETELEAAAVPEGDGLRVRGSEPLKMTDFGIKPPTMFMGALKTADAVVIHYDLVLGLKP